MSELIETAQAVKQMMTEINQINKDIANLIARERKKIAELMRRKERLEQGAEELAQKGGIPIFAVNLFYLPPPRSKLRKTLESGKAIIIEKPPDEATVILLGAQRTGKIISRYSKKFSLQVELTEIRLANNTIVWYALIKNKNPWGYFLDKPPKERKKYPPFVSR